MNKFVHLHLHTEFSLLDGACRIKDIASRLKEIGQDSCAITDHGVMYGVIDFYRAMKNEGIKPIIGCEVYVAPRKNTDKIGTIDGANNHMILLCKDNEGYQNLIDLVSDAYVNGFYKKPRIDIERLKTRTSGLICLSACLAGRIPRLIMEDNYEEAKSTALEYEKMFGKGNFYLEIQDHGIREQGLVTRKLVQMSEETGIPLVATNDVHYLRKADAHNQKVLMCIQMGRTVDDPSKMEFETNEFYMKSYDEMLEIFPYQEEALNNTALIAEKCNVEFEFGNYHLPEFNVPEGFTALEFFKKLCNDGLRERFPDTYEEYQERLDFEMDMILQMGFVDYFLITSDFIMYAKNNDIPVGPGRGSAAGSMVAYVLKITDIDPVKYSLYFERFLNPERISMPDIDIDFCYVNRSRVIDYVNDKYGKDKVAQIVTFGTMAARGSIRDVGRALNIPYADVDKVAKLIPTELHMTLDKALKVSKDLKLIYDNDDTIKELIDTARALEGMPRHASTHAAGVVITKDEVFRHVPLSKNDEQIVTQFPMNTLENLGLLKMDFLGLRNLTVLKDAERSINETDPNFKLENIPYDDAKTFEMLSEGKTAGVFQLESTGITNVVMGLRPESIEDITAIVALYRPGPMQSIPRYIKGRHNKNSVSYKHDILKEILGVTYGCIVYQEQVMEVFRKLAGYSLGKADMVRRAMSKKKFDELNREKQSFIYGNKDENIVGCIANGVDESTANQIFDEILDFANYAFNKAHAVSYAFVSYQTAYFKCHYPREYMSALLTSVLDSSAKVSEYIQTCLDMGIKTLSPSINESRENFVVSGKDIRFGLVAIRNVGRVFTENLVCERTKNGKFTGFEDFIKRMQEYDLNKRAVEALIKCGAFDEFGHTRASLLRVYEIAIEDIGRDRRKNLDGQIGLFGGTTDTTTVINIPPVREFDKKDLLNMEKEMAGIYLSGHPLEEHLDQINRNGIAPIGTLIEDVTGNSEIYKDNMEVTIAGIITSNRVHVTKKNTNMAYLVLEDLTSNIEVICFSRVLDQSGMYIHNDQPVILKGKINAKEDEAPKIICSDIKPLEKDYVDLFLVKEFVIDKKEFLSKKPPEKVVWIKVNTLDDVERIKPFSSLYKGDIPIRVYIEETKKRILLSDKYNILITAEILTKLRLEFGEKNVII